MSRITRSCITDENGGARNIEKDRETNDAANTALSTAQETVDADEIITALFSNTRTLPVPTGIENRKYLLLIGLALLFGIAATIYRRRTRGNIQQI